MVDPRLRNDEAAIKFTSEIWHGTIFQYRFENCEIFFELFLLASRDSTVHSFAIVIAKFSLAEVFSENMIFCEVCFLTTISRNFGQSTVE